jgi:hypothetical protein
VNSKGPIPTQASALQPFWPAMANGPKGLTGLAAAARSGCHTAQVGLAARARREHADRGHRVRCVDVARSPAVAGPERRGEGAPAVRGGGAGQGIGDDGSPRRRRGGSGGGGFRRARVTRDESDGAL